MRTPEHEQDETLRSALDFRERVMAAAAFSIAVIDSEGKIILANRAAAEVCGSEVEEVIGRSIYSCIAPNDVVRVAELIHMERGRLRPRPELPSNDTLNLGRR
jgi:PAS domain S-box-containing protein